MALDGMGCQRLSSPHPACSPGGRQPGPPAARTACGTVASMSQPSPQPTEPVVCSAKGCRASASYAVVWNNPKIHAPDREKVWTACDQHRDSLADFVQRRGFLLRVDPL